MHPRHYIAVRRHLAATHGVHPSLVDIYNTDEVALYPSMSTVLVNYSVRNERDVARIACMEFNPQRKCPEFRPWENHALDQIHAAMGVSVDLADNTVVWRHNAQKCDVYAAAARAFARSMLETHEG